MKPTWESAFVCLEIEITLPVPLYSGKSKILKNFRITRERGPPHRAGKSSANPVVCVELLGKTKVDQLHSEVVPVQCDDDTMKHDLCFNRYLDLLSYLVAQLDCYRQIWDDNEVVDLPGSWRWRIMMFCGFKSRWITWTSTKWLVSSCPGGIDQIIHDFEDLVFAIVCTVICTHHLCRQ